MRVTLAWRDGRREAVAAPADRSILEAAEAADVALPFGCRRGTCASCTGRLLAGEVEHRRPPRALDPDDLAAGYVLTCVAEPRSDCRVEVGTAVQGDLVANPWR